ncbi:putative carbamoyl transferase, NodU family, partial [Lachnospiraceae bacterium JC7]
EKNETKVIQLGENLTLPPDYFQLIIVDGEIIAAAQEERFSRIKHDASIPVQAIQYVMKEANIKADDLDAVVYYDSPILTADRFLKNICWNDKDTAEKMVDQYYRKLFGYKFWIGEELSNILGGLGKLGKLLIVKHHISHASSAFYPSPYNDAAILTVDGVGEWTTTGLGYGNNEDLVLYQEIKYPDSIGLLYSAFTYFCGFKVNSGDYKFMGLAPYGKDTYYELIKEKIIDIRPDGSFRLNLEYFDYHRGGSMINERQFEKLFGGPR